MFGINPTAPLSDFVEVIWFADGGAGPGGFELALPTGTVEIVINLDEQKVRSFDLSNPSSFKTLSGPIVCGVHNQPFLIDHSEPHRTLGINCKPGGAAVLLGIDTDATKNLQFELTEVNPLLANQLSALAELGNINPHDLLATVSEILSSHLSEPRNPMVQHAIHQLNNCPTIEIAQLVTESGYSHRRFNQLFRAETGLTAKQFAKVVRFQRVISAIEPLHSPDWAWLAADYGYFDQAHLIHDFRQHAAMTPGEFLENRTDRLNHPRIDI